MQTLKVGPFNYAPYEEYDDEEVHFSVFIASSDRTTILYGDHEHL